MNVAHLIGNGPSKKLFSGIPDAPIFGCNLGEQSLKLEATFIMDRSVIYHLQNNSITLDFPVIIPNSLERHVRNYAKNLRVYDTVPRDLINGESTGHMAVEYLLKKGCREIHMWGFDSLHENSVLSDTQGKIPGSIADPKNYLRWRERWNQIFNSEAGQQCSFLIHR